MLSIYVHIPFCYHKCDYCNFVSFTNSNPIDIQQYVWTLTDEIRKYSIYNHNNKPIKSIFIGGGTPNTLSVDQISNLLETLNQSFNISEKTEITLESNPELLNEEWIVNSNITTYKNKRISIGVQSFVDNELKTIGRVHNSNTAINAIKLAKKYFDNVSIDIIYAVPGQTFNTLKKTLEIAISLDIQHLSAYALTYEEGSKLIQNLRDNTIKPIDIDTEYEMYLLINNVLTNNKFKQYEISNYSTITKNNNKKQTNTCKHNLNYWNRGEYIGFGVAAHSFIKNTRFANTANLKEYCTLIQQNTSTINFYETLTNEEKREEVLLLGLRSGGISISSNYWKDIEKNKINFINECIKNGYATIEKNKFILTATGKYLADEIALKLIR